MGFNKRLNVMRTMGPFSGGGSNPIFHVRARTFFDRRPVIAALESKYLKVAARLGGYMRTTMQRLMKTPRAKAKELRNKRTPDGHEIDGRGHVFDASGAMVSPEKARDVKRKFAEHLARGRASAPGKPPHSHNDGYGNAGALKRLVEFGWDDRVKSLVCGPQLITSPTVPLGGKTVPQLLNEGGKAFIKGFGGESVMGHFRPRPFVEPTAEKGFTKLADLLRTVPLVRTKGR